MSDFKAIHASAKRPVDIWTNYGYYFFSLRFVYLIRNTDITPNQVTIASFLLFLVAAWFFGIGTRSAIITGLIIHQASFVLDCADGQLARYKKRFSPFGAWLDQIADRIKEYVLALSLAYGYSRFHHGVEVWEYALAELFLLFLLEYYEQQRGKIGYKPENRPPVSERASANADNLVKRGTILENLRQLRSYIPFRGFTIGEQYFLTFAMLLLTDARTTLAVITYVALIMAIYHPLVTVAKLRLDS